MTSVRLICAVHFFAMNCRDLPRSILWRERPIGFFSIRNRLLRLFASIINSQLLVKAGDHFSNARFRESFGPDSVASLQRFQPLLEDAKLFFRLLIFGRIHLVPKLRLGTLFRETLFRETEFRSSPFPNRSLGTRGNRSLGTRGVWERGETHLHQPFAPPVCLSCTAKELDPFVPVRIILCGKDVFRPSG